EELITRKKVGGKVGESQLTSSHVEQVVSDIGKGTTPMQDFVVPTVDNTRPVSYTNVVPMKPTFVPGSANDVIKGLDLSENNKGPVSFAKLVTGEPSRKSMNFCTLVAPTGNEVDVAISLESVRAIIKRFANTFYGFFLEKWVAYPKIVSNVVKNLKNPRQARGVQVGPNVGFKLVKHVYRPVSNKNGACTNSNKKQAEVARQEVAGKGSLNVSPGSSSTTPIVEKIDKLERQILDAKLIFVDDDGSPYWNNGEKQNGIMIDPYDDDLYESHDMSDNLQAICDDFDIKVHGRKKK
ncbi:hypothetical protein Tco_1020847, partial [Tanacetum coccineum]